MAVVVEEGRIRRVAPDAEVPVLPGDWEVACRGRLLAPGLGGLPRAPGRRAAAARHRRAPAAQPPRRRAASARRSWRRCSRAEDVEALTALRARLRAAQRGDPGGGAPGLPRGRGRRRSRPRRAPPSGWACGWSPATPPTAWAAPRPRTPRWRPTPPSRARTRSHPLVRGALGFHASSTCEDALLRRARAPARGAGRAARVPPRRGRGRPHRHLRPPRPAHRRRGWRPSGCWGRAASAALRARAWTAPSASGWRWAGTFLALAPRRLAPAGAGRRQPGDAARAPAPAWAWAARGHGTLWEALHAAFVTLLLQARARAGCWTRTARSRSCWWTAPRSCAPCSSARPRARWRRARSRTSWSTTAARARTRRRADCPHLLGALARSPGGLDHRGRARHRARGPAAGRGLPRAGARGRRARARRRCGPRRLASEPAARPAPRSCERLRAAREPPRAPLLAGPAHPACACSTARRTACRT